MAKNIENTAQLSFGSTTLPPTCPVVTRIEPGLKAIKYATTDYGRIYETGELGQNRKVIYDILLSNYSSRDFTDVIIKDSIVTVPGMLSNQITYVREESMYDNTGTLPQIILEVGTLEAESNKLVHYTLQFAKSVLVNTKIDNKAKVYYSENTNIDENGEQIPVNTNSISLIVKHSDIQIESTKIAPDNVHCSESFNYVLTFKNTGGNVATDIIVSDNLPQGFDVDSITVKNGDSDLAKDINYTYTVSSGLLTITSIEGGLNIEPGSQLVITIKGKFSCL